MMKWALGALLLAVSLSASAAERVALVIGNNAYPSNGLHNPVNDAQDLSKLLKKLNFEVIPVLNGSKANMNSKITQFLQKINSKTKIALFFYSGHGSQYRGANYLIPIDANLQNASTLPSSSITAQSILGKMDARRAGLNIIVIDACRTSPYQGVANIRGKSISKMKGDLKGLSREYTNTQVPTLVAYATSPGMIAKDGKGRNSPYTTALLRLIEKRNLPINQVFNNVSLAVKKTTHGTQIPWNNMSAIPNISLGNVSSATDDNKTHPFQIFTDKELEEQKRRNDEKRKGAKRREELKKKEAKRKEELAKDEEAKRREEKNTFVKEWASGWGNGTPRWGIDNSPYMPNDFNITWGNSNNWNENSNGNVIVNRGENITISGNINGNAIVHNGGRLTVLGNVNGNAIIHKGGFLDVKGRINGNLIRH